MKSKIEQLVLGMVSTNTWFLMNTESKEMVLLDPADEAERIEQKIAQMEGIPKAVLLTHGHFDHMMAAEALQQRYGISVYALREEKALLENPGMNLSGLWAKPYSFTPDQWVTDGEELSLAGFFIHVFHTPGHTAGSCCYYIKEEHVLFSGDTLFAGSVGRTDFPTSDGGKMRESVHFLLEKFPDETRVYPGHNEETTIGYEKRYNPFA